MRRSSSSQLNLFDWTPTSRTDIRAACIAAFATASAAAVGARYGLSRSSVLGHIHRARLAGEVVATRPTRIPGGKQRAAKATPVPVTPAVPPIGVRTMQVGTPMPTIRRDIEPLIVAEVADMHPLFGLHDRQCRAIVDGEIGECCGLPTEGRSSWCRAHRAAYRAGVRPLNIGGL